MTFEQLHPDVVKLDNYSTLLTYRQLSEQGRVLEAWERADSSSPWQNVTLREQEIERLKLEMAKTQRELNKMKVQDEEA